MKNKTIDNLINITGKLLNDYVDEIYEDVKMINYKSEFETDICKKCNYENICYGKIGMPLSILECYSKYLEKKIKHRCQGCEDIRILKLRITELNKHLEREQNLTCKECSHSKVEELKDKIYYLIGDDWDNLYEESYRKLRDQENG